jgi:hypothetical protein
VLVYIEKPPVHNDGSDHVWQLKRSLYGLKQAGREWHTVLCALLNELSFSRAGYDPASFVATKDLREKRIVFMWVDDLIIVSRQQSCDQVVKAILNKYNGKHLGEAS